MEAPMLFNQTIRGILLIVLFVSCSESPMESEVESEAESEAESDWGAVEWSFSELVEKDLALLVQEGVRESERELLERGLEANGIEFIWLVNRTKLKRVLEGIRNQKGLVTVTAGTQGHFRISDGFERSVPGRTITIRVSREGFQMVRVNFF
jgi:hypothetical protein